MCHTHWYEKMRLVNELIYRVDGSCMGGVGICQAVLFCVDIMELRINHWFPTHYCFESHTKQKVKKPNQIIYFCLFGDKKIIYLFNLVYFASNITLKTLIK
jgi:hypothetical protein